MEATPETLSILQEISRYCDPCQRMATRPLTFPVTMPEGIIFSHQLAPDLMWINSNPVLYVLDTHTDFSAAQFLQGEDTESVWLAFITAWVSIYIGSPDSILTDQGSVLASESGR